MRLRDARRTGFPGRAGPSKMIGGGREKGRGVGGTLGARDARASLFDSGVQNLARMNWLDSPSLTGASKMSNMGGSEIAAGSSRGCADVGAVDARLAGDACMSRRGCRP